MFEELVFSFCPTKIKGKERPRFRRTKNFVATYTPKGTKDFENEIKDAYVAVYGNKKISTPISIDIEVIFAIPKSWTNKKKKEYYNTPHCVKPDIDNIIKAILDALNGVAYDDDSLVCDIHASKIFGSNDRNYMKIKIKEYRN